MIGACHDREKAPPLVSDDNADAVWLLTSVLGRHFMLVMSFDVRFLVFSHGKSSASGFGASALGANMSFGRKTAFFRISKARCATPVTPVAKDSIGR